MKLLANRQQYIHVAFGLFCRCIEVTERSHMYVASEARDALLPAYSYVLFREPIALHQQAQSATSS